MTYYQNYGFREFFFFNFYLFYLILYLFNEDYGQSMATSRFLRFFYLFNVLFPIFDYFYDTTQDTDISNMHILYIFGYDMCKICT